MELTDAELESVAAGKGTPQVFGRMFTTRPFVPWSQTFWERHFVAK